jgi:hypothetical protein
VLDGPITGEGTFACVERQIVFVIYFVALAFSIVVVQTSGDGCAFAVPFEMIG